MTDEELGRELHRIWMEGSKPHKFYAAMGAKARTLLAAERPEVTREAVDKFLADVSGIPSVFRLLVNRDAVIDFLKIAIPYFSTALATHPDRYAAEVARLREELRIVEQRIPSLVNVLEGGGNDMTAESWKIIRTRIRAAIEKETQA